MSIRILPRAFMLLALIFLCGAHLKYSKIQRAEESLRVFTQQLRDRQFEESQQAIATAINLSENNAHYLSNAGLLHERMLRRRFDFEKFRNPEFSDEETGHIQTAIQLFQRALALNRFDDHACHNLGWLHWFLKQRQESLAYLQQAVKINGEIPLYHISLGLLHEYSGELEAAYQEYGEAIRISPGITDSQFFIDLRQRSTLQAEKIVSEAISHFEEQVRLGAGPTVKAKLGKLILDRQPDMAAKALQEASIELPNMSRPWINLGLWYERQGAADQAVPSYRKAIFIDGGDATAFLHLGKYYDQQQRTPDAIFYYRRAVSSWTDQNTIHASRVRRIYFSRSAVRDDVIPMGLTAYTNPAFDINWTCTRLSALYRQLGNEGLAEQYEQLKKEYVP